MAYPGEIARGDTVRWFDYLQDRELVGEVVRCARDGLWCDVRYPITPHEPFPDITHLTKRVRITKLHLIHKAAQ
jgi:hypothetical protein